MIASEVLPPYATAFTFGELPSGGARLQDRIGIQTEENISDVVTDLLLLRHRFIRRRFALEFLEHGPRLFISAKLVTKPIHAFTSLS